MRTPSSTKQAGGSAWERLVALLSLTLFIAMPGVASVEAIAPGVAVAGTYNVQVCGGPGQQHALGFSSNDTSQISNAVWCGHSGVQVWSSHSVSGGQAGGWWFYAPSGTTITNLSTSGEFSAWGGWVSHWATKLGGGGDPFADNIVSDCPYTSCDNIVTGEQSTSVSNATTLGFGIWCDASSCPANDSNSYFGPAASANVYDATITVNDPAPPSFQTDTGSLANPPTWISDANAPAGGWTLTADPGDPAGVCGLSISVGSEQDQDNVNPDYTQAAPCGSSPRSTSFTLNPCALSDGSYILSESATNPAGMTGYGPTNGRTINIDCTPPTAQVASAPSSSQWYSTAQQVVFTAADNFSGVEQLNCNDGNHPGSNYTETVSAQGTTEASCTPVDNAQNVGRAASAAVNLDFQTPTIAFTGPSQSAWVSGPQTVTAVASETQQLSGIASVSCRVNGGSPVSTAGSQQSVKLVADGSSTVSCTAATGAEVTQPAETSTVHIDSDPPTIAFSNGPDQAKWSTTAQTIDVNATDQSGLSGVQLISCTIGGQTTTYTTNKTQITVQPPGGQLTCRAQDNAGNWSATAAWSFLIDNTPPTGEFLASDPQDPAQMQVQVADTGSGVAGVQIEIQAATGWQQLPTAYDATTGIATATIPDNGTLADGTYQLQALVWDLAGNEATITQDAVSGRPAAVTLPLRIVTQLIVGRVEVLRMQCSLVREIIRHADRRPHRAASSRLDRVCDAIAIPKEAAAIKLRYGQPATITGLLRRSTGSRSAGSRSRSTNRHRAGPNSRKAASRQTRRAGSATESRPARPGPCRSPTPAPTSYAPAPRPPACSCRAKARST